MNKKNEQEQTVLLCPTCGCEIIGERYAICRRDNSTKLCSNCGTAQGLADFVNRPKPDHYPKKGGA